MLTLMVLWLLFIIAVWMMVMMNVREKQPTRQELHKQFWTGVAKQHPHLVELAERQTSVVRRMEAGARGFGRYWVVGLPRRLVEFLLPPHRLCPPCFEHLSLEQWRDNAKDFVGDDEVLGWCGREGKTVFEWLEARNLPPVPRDEYCPEKRRWVDDMERD